MDKVDIGIKNKELRERIINVKSTLSHITSSESSFMKQVPTAFSQCRSPSTEYISPQIFRKIGRDCSPSYNHSVSK